MWPYYDHQHDLWTMSGIFHCLLTVITEIIRTHLLSTLTHASLVMLRLLYQTSFSDKFHSHFIILQKPILKAKKQNFFTDFHGIFLSFDISSQNLQIEGVPVARHSSTLACKLVTEYLVGHGSIQIWQSLEGETWQGSPGWAKQSSGHRIWNSLLELKWNFIKILILVLILALSVYRPRPVVALDLAGCCDGCYTCW